MAPAAMQQRSAKKRRVSESTQPSQHNGPPTKKKSPLYNQPQNFYAPPTFSSMNKDEISEWRKDQRRSRNRASAASSRIKNKVKVEELEGERDRYKLRCEQLEVQMKEMHNQIASLRRMAAANRCSDVTVDVTPDEVTSKEISSDSQQYSATADNSPAPAIELSIVPSSNNPDLFPALLSTVPNLLSGVKQGSVVKKHVTISRPAHVMY